MRSRKLAQERRLNICVDRRALAWASRCARLGSPRSAGSISPGTGSRRLQARRRAGWRSAGLRSPGTGAPFRAQPGSGREHRPKPACSHARGMHGPQARLPFTAAVMLAGCLGDGASKGREDRRGAADRERSRSPWEVPRCRRFAGFRQPRARDGAPPTPTWQIGTARAPTPAMPIAQGLPNRKQDRRASASAAV